MKKLFALSLVIATMTTVYSQASNEAYASNDLIIEESYSEHTQIEGANGIELEYYQKVNTDHVIVTPNPVKHLLHITTNELGILEIFDMDGNMLRSLKEKRNSNDHDISDLPDGVYILKFRSHDLIYSKRIVKIS